MRWISVIYLFLFSSAVHAGWLITGDYGEVSLLAGNVSGLASYDIGGPQQGSDGEVENEPDPTSKLTSNIDITVLEASFITRRWRGISASLKYVADVSDNSGDMSDLDWFFDENGQTSLGGESYSKSSLDYNRWEASLSLNQAIISNILLAPDSIDWSMGYFYERLDSIDSDGYGIYYEGFFDEDEFEPGTSFPVYVSFEGQRSLRHQLWTQGPLFSVDFNYQLLPTLSVTLGIDYSDWLNMKNRDTHLLRDGTGGTTYSSKGHLSRFRLQAEHRVSGSLTLILSYHYAVMRARGLARALFDYEPGRVKSDLFGRRQALKLGFSREF